MTLACPHFESFQPLQSQTTRTRYSFIKVHSKKRDNNHERFDEVFGSFGDEGLFSLSEETISVVVDDVDFF